MFAASLSCAEDRTPKPYAPGEFPAWMQDLWRAEVIAVGSFPFALFAAFEVYDTWRYFANDMSPVYAPWPLRPANGAPYSQQENTWIVVSAATISLLVSGVDFLLGRLDEPSAAR
jgi:hypothetical protein